ncbi:hypothetical protein GCM10010129_54710 [Streptomyces fumigatiscleroticus]|nr:hypothetical protein GCM10010129_54710 [Streptomyces fumigatiscleroticus]
MAAGLAVTAAALVAAGPRDADRTRGRPEGSPSAHAASSAEQRSVHARPAAGTVRAPVRIADAATVRLLRPGDRVDVIAAEETATGTRVHVVARRARVTTVPGAGGSSDSGSSSNPGGSSDSMGSPDSVDSPDSGGSSGPESWDSVDSAGGVAGDGALIVLAVPRPTAARLAGASATARLAVTLW